MYEITDYSKKKAKALGVTIKPSTNKKKKIDVFKNGNKLTSIGAIGYKDYPTYMKEQGKQYADERRRLYKLRHANETQKKDSASFYATNILW